MEIKKGVRIRIHDEMWFEIDEYGFVTLIRYHENSERVDKVTLPKPIREKTDSNCLIHLLALNISKS